MTPDIKSIASSLRSCALALEKYNKGLGDPGGGGVKVKPSQSPRTTAAGTIDRRTKAGKAMIAAKSKGKRASNGIRAH